MVKKIEGEQERVERKLVFDKLRKISNFFVKNKKGEVISTNIKYLGEFPDEYGNGFSRLNDGELASFFEIGLKEKIYCKGANSPLVLWTSGTPDWNTIKYLVEEVGLNINEALQVFFSLCGDCVNELIAYVHREEFIRGGNTKCEYCVPVNENSETSIETSIEMKGDDNIE